jgi:lipase chaperone LimK
VQNDLRALPEAERREHLRQLRTAVGMDEAALGRWDELDAVRAERWKTGKHYLEERAKLQATVQGDELEADIIRLQQRIFGEEAEMIHNEEVNGYFRYEGEQQFGVN